MTGFIIKKQREAIQTALSGHNFMLVGPAGTGKSYVINNIYHELKAQGTILYALPVFKLPVDHCV